jgi:uncharacterized protein (TIGR02996 family)
VIADGEPFLKAILADPLNDGPRLVYADWLDERGDPRGEFIRVQCELTNPERCGSMCRCDRCETLRRRERELWHVNAQGGFSDLPKGFSATTANAKGEVNPGDIIGPIKAELAVVRRGFVDELRCDTNPFLEHAETLFQEHPISGVKLCDRRPADRTGVNGRWYWLRGGRRLRRPDPESYLPDELFESLFDSPSEDEAVIGLPFKSERDAEFALSAACVKYGRELAGLPYPYSAAGRTVPCV